MTPRLPFLLLLCSSIPGYSWDARFSEQVNAIHDGADAAIVLRVVNSDGMPVENANVWVGFACNAKGKSSTQESVTDTNGLVALQGLTSGQINYRITKDRFYRTEGRLDFGKAVPPVVAGRWQPWNATNRAVLRQVRNPVAMYAKRVEGNLPSLGEPCAYDLKVGDWVAPFGKGEIGDFVFLVVGKEIVSWTDFKGSLSMSFNGGGNGFYKREDECVGESLFAWSYNAPTNGYSQNWTIDVGYAPGQRFYETNQSAACYFRARTATNEEGEIVFANYGKIAGPITFDVRDTSTAWLKFTYYLNPTPNDRNMEFDPKQNLFTNLSPQEKVTAP